MRSLFFLGCLISWSGASRSPRQQPSSESNGHGWDIRLAVPGEPGSDYPTFGNIPRTSFSCARKAPGYYADLETNCQAFRVCTSGSTYGFQSFLCPNGTLFNQAVFVCDWWMNVNCQRSEDLFDTNNDKFGNLKLSPQLMKDIKKMITHSMRNPYDKTAIKSNLIVMQDYKAPFGQMFPNNALLSGSQRAPNNVYVPAKLQQSYNSDGNVFAASTTSPQYVPPSNSLTPAQRDAEVFQRQRQNGQYQQSSKLQNGQYHLSGKLQNGQYQPSGQLLNGQYQPSGHLQNGQYQASGQLQNGQYHKSGKLQNGQYQHSGKLQNGQYQHSGKLKNGQYQQSGRLQITQQAQFSNGHTGYTQSQNSAFSEAPRPVQNYNSGQYNQKQTAYSTQNQQSGRFIDNTRQLNSGKQSGFEISYAKQQYNNYNPNQANQGYELPLPLNNDNTAHVNTEAKQNLVSSDVPATIITKTLTFNRISDPKPGGPKSRITLKTWIVKPSKSAKLIADPTAYTYNKPTNPSPAKIIDDTTPYVYNPPTVAQTERIAQAPDVGYAYNKPTTPSKQVQQNVGYVYNKPTAAAKQVVKQPSRFYLHPTLPPPTLSGRLYLTPATLPPTVASKLYLAPTTYKPSANRYIPPSQANLILSRQYLSPSALQQPSYYQSEQLQASPTTPNPVYTHPPDNPSFSLTKHSRINANHNNLTFADILTKEKLDITVNDIVSDTSNALKTAAPQFGQLREDEPTDYPDASYIPPESDDSDENLTPQSPTVVSPSSRLILDPSRELEPPFESNPNELNTNHQNSNPLSDLPYFKERTTNTIERTVSLKISIPEKVASYLFKTPNNTEYDKLEILNTGSSNYLVLSNNFINKNTGANFIPIGRLITDKTSNISDSQALVFSFLQDSLNAAKEYNDIAKQNIITPTPQQFQNVNSGDLARITDNISQLTASQYSGNQNSNYNNGNHVSTQSNANQYHPAKYTNFQQNQQQIQSAQLNSDQQINQDLLQYQGNNGINANLQLSHQNQKQVYSGQLYKLPVPDVTTQIYNAESANLVQANNVQQNTEVSNLSGIIHNSNLGKQSSSEVEIVQSRTLPVPAKLQFSPSNEGETFNSHQNSAQAILGNFLSNDNGISAQLQDKIVGTIPHPIEDNKLVTYKKDQSYYVYTKLNNNIENENAQNQQNAKLIQNTPNVVTFQFIPSVSYKLEDEKEQQKILNAFQIDEYGSPKRSQVVDRRQDTILTSDVNYSVDHPGSERQVDGQFEVNTLYTGPSSYSAPQASVTSLEQAQNPNSRLEQLDDSNSNGYPKVTPVRQFTFK